MGSTTTNPQRMHADAGRPRTPRPSRPVKTAISQGKTMRIDECRACVSPSGPQAFFSYAAKAFVLVAAAICLACVLMPSAAFAKSYTCPSVEMDAAVNADGSLSVTEKRTFVFDGSYSAVWWTFDALPSEESAISIASVEVSSVSDTASAAPAPDREGSAAPAAAAGEVAAGSAALPEVDFQRAWRDAGGPADPAFSLDADRKTAYVFYPFEDGRFEVTLTYAISNFVQVYDDVAEVYWQYVGHGWSVDSDRVVATLHLPVAAGADATAGSAVRAWGHGPLDGALSLDNAGTISATVPTVRAGGYAEVHAVFPRSWISELAPNAPVVHTGDRLESVLDDEGRMAKRADAERIKSLALIAGCLLVSVAVIVWALVVFFRYGKEHKPSFNDEYWRDVPEKGVHPAVIARLWRWDAESPHDFTATLMHLSAIGAVRLDAGSYEREGRRGIESVNDYYVTRLSGWQDKVQGSPVDERAMALLFDTVAPGSDSVWFGSVKHFAEQDPEAFSAAMQAWQGVLSAETNRYDFFEAKGKRYQGTMIVMAVLGLVAGVVGAFAFDTFVPLITAVPAIVALFVISGVMARRSKHAVELFAKCVALRRWLKDFSALDERLPTDVKVWGEMMVYAYVLGVADEAIKALRSRMPDVLESPDFAPVYYWLMPHYYNMGVAASAMESPLEAFSAMQADTAETVRAALSAASGSFSDAGGAGGGFSGGAGFSGGGFGGTGGGAR